MADIHLFPFSPSLVVTDPPINLTHLHSFTNGKASEERFLFDMFRNLAEASIHQLEQAFINAQAEEWRQAAHALKDAATDLGADQLATLCHKAEQHYHNPKKYAALLYDISQALTEVTLFITTLEANE